MSIQISNFQVLLSLFQVDGSINEMLFWAKILFLKAMCDLVLLIFLEGKNSGAVTFQYWKTFVATRCSTLFFLGSQFIYIAPTWCLELSFKQKRIPLFWITFVFFLIFLLTKGYQEIHAWTKCRWIKELYKNPWNFGFKNLNFDCVRTVTLQ